jgi:LCP family protein required for cell wall assembly
VHTAECYTALEPAYLTCLQTDPVFQTVHQHTDACYEKDEHGNRIGLPICGYADFVLHTHTAECYNSQGQLICPIPENKGPVFGGEASGDSSAGAETPVEIEYDDGVVPKTTGERKSERYYTILVLGRDTGGGGNTDTMLIASYDVTNQKATVMSIPRDTMVNVSWDSKKINSVYNVYGGGSKGLQAVYKEVSQLVGFEPDFEVVVEWEAVGALVDAIGGIWFDVPYTMDYHDPYQDLIIEQEKGYRFLNGDDAMQVIRWRKNDPESPHGYTKGIGDAGRMKLQQDFLKAVITQLLQVQNVAKVSDLAKVFGENVQTSLSFKNILWFGMQAIQGGLKVEDVTFTTMPYKYADAYSRNHSKKLGYPYYLAYVVPKAEELLELVNASLSPFKDPFVLEDLDIMYVNKDGSIGSTTGYVADKEAAQPPPIQETKPQENGNSGGTAAPVEPPVPGEEAGNAGNAAENGTEVGGNVTTGNNVPLVPSEPVSGVVTPTEPTPVAPTPGGATSVESAPVGAETGTA